MTQEKPRDDRTRVIGVRLTEDEIAVLPPAESDSGRVRASLMIAHQLGPALGTLADLAAVATTLKEDLAALSARVDARSAALDARIQKLTHGPDAFNRLTLEADARDIETCVSDVWMVCMEIWQQTINNHLNISVIREALVDGDGDPETLRRERGARIQKLMPERFRDFNARAGWMIAVTDEWREMRERERQEHLATLEKQGAATAAAAAE